MMTATVSRELNTLRLMRDRVSLESMNLGPAVESLAARYFPTITETFTKFTDGLTALRQKLTMLDFSSGGSHPFLKRISGIQYLDIAELTVYVPEGLQTSYLEYSNELNAAAQRAAGVEAELSKFSKYIAVLLSDRQAKIDHVLNAQEFTTMAKSRAAVVEAMAQHFAKGSTRTDVRYATAVRRNSEWETIYKNVEHQQKLLNPAALEHVRKKMDECVDLLDRLVKSAERGEFQDAAPEQIKKLSNYVYEMASELEFFSVVFYRCRALAESVDATMKKVDKVVKNFK